MAKLGGSCLGGSKSCDARDDEDYAYAAAPQSARRAREYRQTAMYPDLSRADGADTTSYQDGVSAYYVDNREQMDDAAAYSDPEDGHRYDGAEPADDPSAAYPRGGGYASSGASESDLAARGGGGALASTADGENRCHCEYLMFDNFKWVKQQHYAVVRDGREYFDRYVVTYRLPNSNVQHDMFTYAEGAAHSGPIENRFPHLCGEVLSSHPLPPVNSLDRVCYYAEPSVDPDAPFHVQEEMCKTNALRAVPLTVDTAHQVLVFRTYHDTLALQLMPTAYSERAVVSGTPLFHGARRSVCAVVGTMFSDFHYAINGAPCLYALFPLGARDKNDPADADRMRVIVLDRRSRVDSAEWTATDSVLNGVADVALPVVQRFEGKQARLDVRDVLYVGVVNGALQMTDAPNVSKKYKSPRNAVVVVVDDRGVYATQVRDRDIVGQWVQRDARVAYSVLPRYYFDRPRSTVVRANTSDANAKLKRAKSREVLI